MVNGTHAGLLVTLAVELRGTACTVRSYRATDVERLAYYGNNRAVWLNLRDAFPHPYRVEDGARYITRCREAEPETSFAIDVGGEAVGGISIRAGTDVERFGAEIGYWLGEPFWGRGIATAAVLLVTAYAFEVCKLERVYALPFARNTASARVLEKAGYMREGVLRHHSFKDGAFTDQFLYAKLSHE